MDKGKEWVLLLFVQELLAGYRYNQDRPAHFKSASTENYTIERIWPEVNSRINYPIKNILVDLEEKELFDLTCKVASEGMERFVQSWNNHKIQGNYYYILHVSYVEIICQFYRGTCRHGVDTAWILDHISSHPSG